MKCTYVDHNERKYFILLQIVFIKEQKHTKLSWIFLSLTTQAIKHTKISYNDNILKKLNSSIKKV